MKTAGRRLALVAALAGGIAVGTAAPALAQDDDSGFPVPVLGEFSPPIVGNDGETSGNDFGSGTGNDTEVDNDTADEDQPVAGVIPDVPSLG